MGAYVPALSLMAMLVLSKSGGVAMAASSLVDHDIEMLAQRLQESDLPNEEKGHAMDNILRMKHDIDAIPQAPPSVADSLRRAVELRLAVLREQLQDHEGNPADLVSSDVATLKEAIKTSGMPEESQVAALLNLAKIQRDVGEIRTASSDRAVELREAIKLRLSALNHMLGSEGGANGHSVEVTQSAIDNSLGGDDDGIASVLSGITVLPIMLGLLLGGLAGTAMEGDGVETNEKANNEATMMNPFFPSFEQNDEEPGKIDNDQQQQNQAQETTSGLPPVIEALASLFSPQEEEEGDEEDEQKSRDASAGDYSNDYTNEDFGDIYHQQVPSMIPLLAGGIRCPVMRQLFAAAAPPTPPVTVENQLLEQNMFGSNPVMEEDEAAAAAAAAAIARMEAMRMAASYSPFGGSSVFRPHAFGYGFPSPAASPQVFHTMMPPLASSFMIPEQQQQFPSSLPPPSPIATFGLADAQLEPIHVMHIPPRIEDDDDMDNEMVTRTNSDQEEDDASEVPVGTQRTPAQAAAREPMILTCEEKDGFHVISGFFPGVRKEDLHVKLMGNMLHVNANVNQKDDTDLALDNMLHINLANADSIEEELELPYAPAAALFKAHFNEQKHTLVAVFPVQTETIVDVE